MFLFLVVWVVVCGGVMVVGGSDLWVGDVEEDVL